MKKFLLFAVMLPFGVSCFAKIWRVNNNAGITADFTTLQAAHNGAASGDTLYLESSPASYGSATFTKKLTVVGTGYFLDQNQNLQAFALASKVSTIFLNAGSGGSVIEGLWTEAAHIYISVNDIVIRRNNFGNVNGTTPDWTTGNIIIGYQGAGNNVIISQNFGCTITNSLASTGILILNNHLAVGANAGDATSNGCLLLYQNTVAIIKNNVFRRGTVQVYNSNLSNNIMYVGSFNGSGNLVSNNIGNGTQFGTADGNQSNVSMASVFQLTGSSDGFFKLKAGSPAIGAGYGSTLSNPVDAGMFGGSTPYVLSGLPAIPSIYFFANQPVGSNSDPIDVQIKVRSNN